MPKATLMYNLPEEQSEFDAARVGREALSALWEIDQYCRSILKHGSPPPEQRELVEYIRRMIPGELLEI